MTRKRRTLADRLWAKVKIAGPDECWEWLGGKDRKGYGRILLEGKKLTSAHRAALFLESGEMPTPDLDACHSCDNPGCVNPKHLFFGSRKENMRDCIDKGRFSYPPRHIGERAHKAKLTESSVRKIRSTYPKQSYAELAAKFGVSKQAIAAVVRKRSWAHIKEVSEC